MMSLDYSINVHKHKSLLRIIRIDMILCQHFFLLDFEPILLFMQKGLSFTAQICITCKTLIMCYKLDYITLLWKYHNRTNI